MVLRQLSLTGVNSGQKNDTYQFKGGIMNKEVYINFKKPYQGIEKINEKEYVLHNYRGNIYLAMGSMIAVRQEGKNMDIKEIVIEGDGIIHVQAVKSITGVYVTLKNYVIHDNDGIRIKTELEMGDSPEFMIAYEYMSINDAC